MKLTASQLRRIIKEEVSAVMGKDPQRFLHGFESGHPMDDEGYMIKSRMADVKEMAETICTLLDMGDQLPAWVQDLVASAHTDLEHVKDYLVGDEKIRSYKKPSAPAGMSGVPTESRRRSGKTLKEGHSRITDAEFAAWKRGDWGFVSEGTEAYREMSHDDALAFIASKPAAETAQQDIVDAETGEIYIEAGKAYGDSYHHPEHKLVPRHMPWLADDDADLDAAEESDPQAEFQAALEEFTANMKGMGLGDLDASPEDVASDLALNFFHDYPQWKEWTTALGMTKAEIQSAAAEAAYEALIS